MFLGKRLDKSGAWRDAQLSVFSLPPVAEVFTMPAVTEPFIVWITSGESEAQERENKGPWVTSQLKSGSLFLTAAGAPYDFRGERSPLSRLRSSSFFSAYRFSTRRWRTCLVQMPSTLAFETFLASKIRTSFRFCRNCKRRQ
jgi:hypothetical protein